MDVAEVLARALDAVNAAKIPDDLREAAFNQAVTLLTEGRRPSAPKAPKGKDDSPIETDEGSTGDEYAAIAARAGITAEEARDLFELGPGTVGFDIPSQNIKASKKVAQRELAIIVAGARQAAGLEEYTSTRIIRAVCDDYGKLDGNFSTYIGDMGVYFKTQVENSKSTLLRLKRQGWDEFARCMQAMSPGRSQG